WQCVKERKKEAIAIPILRDAIIPHSQPLLHSSISGGIDETAKKKKNCCFLVLLLLSSILQFEPQMFHFLLGIASFLIQT
ncbi:hypothetical protein S83_062904, partial [Arachis hypogaea]